MATIKSFTSVEQSRKLAEILPLESADMCYIKHSSSDNSTWEFNEDFPPMILGDVPINEITAETLPCWSLAALLGILPKYELNNFGDTIQLAVSREALATEGDETLLDLVVNMIIHLHELNLL